MKSGAFHETAPCVGKRTSLRITRNEALPLSLGAMSSEPLPSLPGFTLEGILGQGSMGRVYRARDAEGRTVALKVLRGEGHPSRHTRFQREVESLSRLRHPNVVKTFASGHTPNGQLFYTMELLERRSLAEVLAGS